MRGQKKTLQTSLGIESTDGQTCFAKQFLGFVPSQQRVTGGPSAKRDGVSQTREVFRHLNRSPSAGIQFFTRLRAIAVNKQRKEKGRPNLLGSGGSAGRARSSPRAGGHLRAAPPGPVGLGSSAASVWRQRHDSRETGGGKNNAPNPGQKTNQNKKNNPPKNRRKRLPAPIRPAVPPRTAVRREGRAAATALTPAARPQPVSPRCGGQPRYQTRPASPRPGRARPAALRLPPLPAGPGGGRGRAFPQCFVGTLTSGSKMA